MQNQDDSQHSAPVSGSSGGPLQGFTCLALPKVAAILGVTETTVRRLIKRGDLRAIRVGVQLRVTEAELRHLLELSEE